ncbi:MAG: alpha/beta hydrolase family protein [Rikenellaceae bacterium]
MKNIKHFYFSLLLVVLAFVAQGSYAARVDSLSVYSPSMDKFVECRVVTPDCYSQGERLPTVYLLHGYSGDAKVWVEKYDIEALADQYSMIVVAPDGGFSSWYWDSPIDSSMKYETFVARELIDFIDSEFLTIPDRKARAVTGLSMGGQGAFYLSIRNQDVFGAVGSMSGGVDIRPFPENWHMSQRLGTIEEHPENWEEFTVMNQLDRLEPNSLAIIFDCGVDDFFYEVNNALHAELERRKIPHRYTSAPGAHTLPYWRKSLPYHFMFFDDFFKPVKAK